MITLRHERSTDVKAREALLDEAFGAARYRKSSQRLRDGRLPAEGLSFIAAEGRRVIGTARLWHVECASGQPALLLGPVAVAADCRQRGIGAALVRRALRDARRIGHGAVILVGDAPYYGRFGFSAEKTGRVVVIHEAPRTGGLGGEIAAIIQEQAFYSLLAPVRRVTGWDTVFPLKRSEGHYLPNADRIVQAAEQTLED